MRHATKVFRSEWQRSRCVALCTLPLLLHAADAHAWGLYTHLYFAQLLMWAVPLVDPHFRRALRRFPELVLAGTCLPDVSLFSGLPGAGELRATHRWTSAQRLLRDAADDSERAIALGYSSHLMTDVVAHNYFVPAHDEMWFRAALLSHAASEWAMDAHLAPHLFARPAPLLAAHGAVLASFAGRRLRARALDIAPAVRYLARGERLLRMSRLPQVVYAIAGLADGGLTRRFDEYVRETSTRLRQINRLIAGEVPAWLPEPPAICPGPRPLPHAPLQAMLLPTDFFREMSLRAQERKPPE